MLRREFFRVRFMERGFLGVILLLEREVGKKNLFWKIKLLVYFRVFNDILALII